MFVVFVVATTVLGGPLVVALLLGAPADWSMRVARAWSGWLLAALGAEVRYEGLERLRADAPCVVISNHQSNADIWVLTRALPLSARFVAKRELLRVPIVGQVLRLAEFITIDRRDRSAAIRSLELAGRRIREGRTVVLFAEGTRSPDGRLQPFKKGPFHLALAARVPVVPVAIEGSGRALAPRGLRARRGRIVVRFLEPVEPATFADMRPDELAELIRGRVAAALGEPRAPARVERASGRAAERA